MKPAVERLREEIEALVTQAYQQDEADEAALGSRRGDELPAELARREVDRNFKRYFATAVRHTPSGCSGTAVRPVWFLRLPGSIFFACILHI